MFAYHANEKTVQSIVDEYLETIPVEMQSDPMLCLRESDFEALGYVVYWIERDQYLSPLKENNMPLFHGLLTWSKRFEMRGDATSIATLLLQMSHNPNTGFKVFKLVSNETAVVATIEAQRKALKKKPKFTGEEHPTPFVILLSPVWSNYPFEGGRPMDSVC